MKAKPVSGRYRTLLIDPPWPVKSNQSPIPYSTMPLTKIAALPIGQLTEKHSTVFLWTTNSMMEEAFGLLRLWRLTYTQTITWCKNYGLGRAPYTATEHMLMAFKGQPGRGHMTDGYTRLSDGNLWLTHPRPLNWFSTQHRPKHSEKPEEAYKLIESISEGPYLEMFARTQRPGWSAWGNQLPQTP